MKKVTKATDTSLIIATLLAVTIIISASGTANLGTSFSAQGQLQGMKFTAQLSGKGEVPPVDTTATGTVQFQLSPDGKELTYDLTTKDLKGFMMAHIHQGKASESGQPVAPLSMGKGKITASDLQGPLSGKQLKDLVDLMSNGGAYVNIHTQQHQDGEIRGQITSS
jgi:CHRD domain